MLSSTLVINELFEVKLNRIFSTGDRPVYNLYSTYNILNYYNVDLTDSTHDIVNNNFCRSSK